MMRLNVTRSFLSTFCALILLAGSLLIPGQSFSGEIEDVGVYFQPAQIILNCPSSGNKQDIQATIGILLRGYRILDYDVDLLFDDVYVTDAVSFRTAWYHLEAGFDRSEVQSFAVDMGIEDTVTKATVEGWFTAESFDGMTTITRHFTGYYDVEIIVPGQ